MSKLEKLDGELYQPLTESEQQDTSGGLFGTFADKTRLGGRIANDYVDDEIAQV